MNKEIGYLLRASELNDLSAYKLLYKIYSENVYILNMDKALEYAQPLIENNDPDILNDLGIYYIYGRFVERNINKGIN